MTQKMTQKKIQKRCSLTISSLSKSFSQGVDEIKVLEKCTYRFEQGRSYAIIGASGAGKSTLLYLLAGLEEPTHGSVSFCMKDLKSLSHDEMHSVSIFQIPHLIDELTLAENVMIKGLIGGRSYHVSLERARSLLSQVGLSEKADQRPRSLSGGEQQRVAVARALFSEPSYILADEPTAHLDGIMAQEIMSLLCNGPWGLILASHDSTITTQLEVTLELKNGSLREIAPQIVPSSGKTMIDHHGR